jgi:hypothetical protein
MAYEYFRSSSFIQSPIFTIQISTKNQSTSSTQIFIVEYKSVHKEHLHSNCNRRAPCSLHSCRPRRPEAAAHSACDLLRQLASAPSLHAENIVATHHSTPSDKRNSPAIYRREICTHESEVHEQIEESSKITPMNCSVTSESNEAKKK